MLSSTLKRKPDVHIYLDEFGKGDLFLFTAIIVPVDRVEAITRELNNLRRAIKSILMSDYYRAPTSPKLAGDLLPELHAVDLFQSLEYYRKHPRGTNLEDTYWLQHREWLEEVLKIALRHGVKWVSTRARDELKAVNELISRNFNELFDLMAAEKATGTKIGGYSRKKLNSLLNSYHYRLLPGVLARIEGELRKDNLYGEIICDDHNDSKGYSVIKAIDFLRATGEFTHLTKPKFADSASTPLLQLADVMCYVAGHRMEAILKKQKADEPFHSWIHNYLDKLWTSPTHDIPDGVSGNALIISMELLYELTIFDPWIKNKLMEIVVEVALEEE